MGDQLDLAIALAAHLHDSGFDQAEARRILNALRRDGQILLRVEALASRGGETEHAIEQARREVP